MGEPRVVVAVDASELGTASRNRGIGTYLRGILAGLGEDERLRVRAVVGRGATLPPGIDAVPVRRLLPSRWRAREHDVRLPRELRSTGAAVAWSPAQEPPARAPMPFVQTLHDATPLLFPHADLAGAAARMRAVRPRFRRAAAWIANSGYTADSCAEVLGLPRHRIEVAHLAPDGRFRPGPARDDGSPYVLYVGEYGPHKGFGEAMAVAGALADRGLPHHLRMAGRVAPWWRPRVDELRAAAPRPDRVEVGGYIEDIVEAYRGASALVFTSRHEGFGLPLVEAMACGTPVVAFANSSVPEVVGDGGVLVADGDVAAMADALAGLLRDAARWRDASDRAIERSRAFSWGRAAAIHAEVLLATASGS